MNNDLEQFSEERLKDMQKHVTAGMTLGHADALLIRRVIDIALAAKQAKPFCYVSTECIKQNVDVGVGVGGGTWAMSQKPYNGGRGFDLVNPLYTIPQPAHTERDGWKLVPIEPTEKMKAAAESEYSLKLAYKAMLRAAPKPESE